MKRLSRGDGIIVNPEFRLNTEKAATGCATLFNSSSKIATVMKSEGAVPGIQIHHGGPQASINVIKRNPPAPSAIPCPTIGGKVKPLTTARIHELVQEFADAAQRAQQADFELIEIHGAHGYLINQFLSRVSNEREDQYGGDIVGRINDPIIANEIIEKGQADLVCIGRGLLADPQIPNKSRVGRLDEIRTCIACNISYIRKSNPSVTKHT